MPELALTLIAALLLAFVAVLELPTTISISIRKDDSGFRLNTVIGLLGGVLRLPITAAEDLTRSIPVQGARDSLWDALSMAVEAPGDTEASRPSLRRRALRLVVSAAASAFGKPGYNCTKLDVRLGLASRSLGDSTCRVRCMHAWGVEPDHPKGDAVLLGRSPFDRRDASL